MKRGRNYLKTLGLGLCLFVAVGFSSKIFAPEPATNFGP